jgi:hypothetical protein
LYFVSTAAHLSGFQETPAVPENSLVSTAEPDKEEGMRGKDEQQLDVFSFMLGPT